VYFHILAVSAPTTGPQAHRPKAGGKGEKKGKKKNNRRKSNSESRNLSLFADGLFLSVCTAHPPHCNHHRHHYHHYRDHRIPPAGSFDRKPT
jgi:hypothetical protein